MEKSRQTRINLGFIFLVFLSLLLSYFFALDTGLIGDDSLWVGIKENDTLIGALTGGLRDRPLLMILIWLEQSLFADNFALYRLVALLLQSLATFQLYLLIKEIRRVENEDLDKVAACLSFLFALHPLHNQSINVVIQNGVIVTSMFGVISIRYFLKYLSNAKIKSILISYTCFTLGMMTKPIISSLPFFYLFASYVFKEQKIKYRIYIPYVLGLLIPVIFYVVYNMNRQTDSTSNTAYFLTQMEVWFVYFRLMIFPYGLKYLYDFYPPQNIILNLNWIYFLLHIIIVYLGFKYLKNRLQKLFFIGFFLSLLPESSFFPINYLAFEHRTYFPLVFLFCFLGAISKNINLAKVRIYQNFAFSLAFVYIILNQVRNFQINSPDSWVLHTLESSQSQHIFNFTFSRALMNKGKLEDLAPIMAKYRRLYPESSTYQILDETYKSFIEPNNTTHLDKIYSYLLAPVDDSRIRLWGNGFLVTRSPQVYSEFESQVFLEKVLSRQMIYFAKEKDEFKGLMNVYEKIALDLTQGKESERYSKLDRINFLKTKAILKHYFGHKFNKLIEEINSELAKAPDSSTLKRLSEMVQ